MTDDGVRIPTARIDISTMPPLSETLTQSTSDYHRLIAFLLNQITLSPQEVCRLAALADTQHVGAYFNYRVHEANVFSACDALTDLAASVQQEAQHQLLQQHIMTNVNAILNKAAITPIWMKGAALAHTIYPQFGMRLKSDLDLIVPLSDYARAVQTLKANGYQESFHGLDLPMGDLAHHVGLRHHQLGSVLIGVHRHLLGYAGERHISRDDLSRWLATTDTFHVFDQTFETLRPAHRFLYLCGHSFLQHGEAHLSVRDLLDLHFCAISGSIDWYLLLSEAHRLHWLPMLKRVFHYLQAFCDTPLPDYVVRTVAPQPDVPAQVAPQIAQLIAVFKSLPVQKRLQLLWWIAVPPKDYMRDRYQVPHQQAMLPYYVYRWGHQVGDAVSLVWQRLRNHNVG